MMYYYFAFTNVVPRTYYWDAIYWPP